MTKKFTKIQLRRDTTAALSNIILTSGEPAFALDTRVLKIGDGLTSWNNLDGVAGEGGSGGLTENEVLTIVNSGISGVIGNAPELLNTLNELSEAIGDDESFSTTILNALNDKADSSGIFNAAVEWTANHTLADGTRYLAGDLVYVSGQIYKAKLDNESISVTDTTYWLNIGSGYRLNIDGRDIQNIPNLFDQDLNTTNSPTFVGINLLNGTALSQGTYDNSTGGQSGISLHCYVGYELNWQGGRLKSTSGDGNVANIYCDSPLEFQGVGPDNVQIDSSGIIFSDGTTLDTANHNHASGDFTSLKVNNTDVLISGSNISLLNNDLDFVKSDNTGITGASGVNNIVKISQSAFDALGGSVDPNTIYFIV